MQKSRPLERGQCEDSNSALQAAKLFHIRRPYWGGLRQDIILWRQIEYTAYSYLYSFKKKLLNSGHKQPCRVDLSP